MRCRAQSALEYVFLIAVTAAALIATLVYVNRGFQGNLRSQADQAGAGGAYSPGNTTVINSEEKKLQSKIVAGSKTTVTYGDSHWPGKEIADLKAQIKELKNELWDLRTQIYLLKLQIKYGGIFLKDPVLIELQAEINAVLKEVKALEAKIPQLEKHIEDLNDKIVLIKADIENIQIQLARDDLTPKEREQWEKKLAERQKDLDEAQQDLTDTQAALNQAKIDKAKDYEKIKKLQVKIQERIDYLLKNNPNMPVNPDMYASTKALESLEKQVSDKQDQLSKLQEKLEKLWKEWQKKPKIADKTFSVSSNEESGTVTQSKQASETLGALSNDRWQK